MNIDKLKSLRSVVRASTTKLINKIDTFLKESSKDFDGIEEAVVLLDDKLRNLRELNEKIYIEIKGTEGLEKEVSLAENYNDEILSCKFKASKYLNACRTTNNNSLIMNITYQLEPQIWMFQNKMKIVRFQQ